MSGETSNPRVLVLTLFPAPYRARLFDLLATEVDLVVVYERKSDYSVHERAAEWYMGQERAKSFCLEDMPAFSTGRRQLLDVGKYDLIVFYEYSTKLSTMLMLQCIVKKIPYAINCDGAFLSGGFVKSKIKRLFISRAAACLAGSQSAVEYFRAYGAVPDRVFVHKFTGMTASEIAANAVTPSRGHLGADELPLVVYVGRPTPKKGIKVLLKAWASLDRVARLRIVGGGSQEPELRQMASSLGLKNIEFVGFIPPSELISQYHQADLFVLPTLEDVWGLVVNEAMAAGLPVVTTDMCNAGVELIGEEGGHVVEAGNVEALARALMHLIESPTERAIKGKRNIRVIQSHTLEAVSDAHVEAFRRVLSLPFREY